MGLMDVLVFSTVPAPSAVAVSAGPSGLYTLPQDLGAFIGDALEDLAEAGLTVTGPDVTQVHPLARHISRTQVIYRFDRSPDYTARQLTEFADWAQYCVFRVGNGPFRNLDGENLAAPGKGVKVPVHLDAYLRRQKNLRTLRQAGLEVNEQIPVIPAEEEVRLRDGAQVVYRLGALRMLIDAARLIREGVFPPADEMLSEKALVDDALTEREQGFLEDVGRARQAAFSDGSGEMIPPALRSEAEVMLQCLPAMEALAWSIQLIDLPPQRLRAWDFDLRVWREAQPGALMEELRDETTATLLVRSPGLRGVTQLLEAFDLVHILFHGLDPEDEGLAEIRALAEQWTKALAWIVSPFRAWGQAERLL